MQMCCRSCCLSVVPELRAEIERLQAQKTKLICEGCRRLGEVAEENERLRAALQAILDDPEIGVNISIYAKTALAPEQHTVTLPAADYEAFVEALDSPQEPNEKLKALMRGSEQTAPKGPAGDAGQVGWMGGEFDR